MAELLGVVAGGAGLASLAIQLLQGAQRLKRFCDDMRDPATKLNNLIYEIETMSLILQEMQHRRSESRHEEDAHGGMIIARCMVAVKRDLVRLQDIIDKIDRRMQKSKHIGKVSIVMSAEDIRTALGELEQAKGSLHIAFGMYQASQRTRMLERLAHNQVSLFGQVQAELTTITATLPALLQHEATTDRFDQSQSRASQDLNQSRPWTEVNALTRRNKQRRREATRFQIRVPSLLWLRRQLWDVTMTHAEGTWKICLHTRNVIPFGSPIFLYCEEGDLMRVQQMLMDGSASAIDCDEYGDSLLCYAARHGQVELCSYLIRNTNASREVHDLQLALGTWAYVKGSVDRNTAIPDLMMYSTFIEGGNMELDIEDTIFEDQCVHPGYKNKNNWWYDCSSEGALNLIIRNSIVEYGSIPLETRIAFCSRMVEWDWVNTDMYWKAVGVTAADIRGGRWDAGVLVNLLHGAAKAFGHLRKHYHKANSFRSWVPYMEAFALTGISASAVVGGITPLMRILHRAELSWGYFSRKLARGIAFAVRKWVELLKDGGFDLLSYGFFEHLEWSGNCVAENGLKGRQFTATEFTYGPSPDDWNVTLCHNRFIRLYRRTYAPGAWPTPSYVPDEICWCPSDEEEKEGQWEDLGHLKLVSQPFVAQIESHSDPFDNLVESTQDDTGVAALMAGADRRPCGSRSRSASQPPLRRRQARIAANHSDFALSENHKWLGRYHLCPITGKHDFRCGCDPRDCAKGVWQFLELHDTWEWKYCSFLAERVRSHR